MRRNALGAVMQVNDDSSASAVFTVGFGVITAAFASLAFRLAVPARNLAEPVAGPPEPSEEMRA